MAGSPPPEKPEFSEAAESSTQPGRLDWEVLSMSTMSASTLGLPSQKPHEIESKDQTYTESMDSAAEGRSSLGLPDSEKDTHIVDTYDSQKEKQLESMQALVGPSHGTPVAEESSSSLEQDTPAKPSKKKKIRVVWWRRQVFNWQPQSKKYSTVLSLALVAAVVGIAVMGRRLYRERNLNHQLRLEVSSKEEKLNDMMYQVNRMKEAMTGRRRIGVSRGSLF